MRAAEELRSGMSVNFSRPRSSLLVYVDLSKCRVWEALAAQFGTGMTANQ